MKKRKIAFLTGITGQDGSYLAELLLEKGYEVHGVVRRSSSFNTGKIDHIFGKLKLHFGDITDPIVITRLISEVQPDEIYNLAAQSHVRVSFDIPYYTAQVDAIGTLNILEAMRTHCPTAKLYQASTSELFGKVIETPQTETTPFYPRSPYGVAKIYGYWIVKNYREAYDLFACNGILFNHETVVDFTPMIFKIGDEIDIKPISEIVKYHTNKNKLSIDINKKEYQETIVTENLEVWDKNKWTKVKYASGYPHDTDNNKNPKFLVSKNAAYLATSSHKCIMENGEEKTFGNIKLGDKVSLIAYPINKNLKNKISEKEAELIGFIVGDGDYNKKENKLRITGKETKYIKKYAEIWENLGGTIHEYQTRSGFNKNEKIWQYNLNGNKEWGKKYLNDIYDEYKKKRVPKLILNSNKNIQLSFLNGYNNADGLKKNPCKYKFKNFKTNSHTLAAGLIFLLQNTTKQKYNINVEKIFKFNKERLYYSINILSNSNKGQNHRNSIEKWNKVEELINKEYSQRKIQRETEISRGFIRKIQNGYIPNNKHHFNIENNSIKKIIDMKEYNGWFFDLETESGTFHAGVGQGHVHNSPRRGLTFVTRKITSELVKIKFGANKTLKLGNLDSQRDWGHAKEYVEGMWRMLQQDTPDDFVLATGELHSVRECVEISAKYLGYEIEWSGSGIDEKGHDKNTGQLLIEIDPAYFRPTEVELLLGDATKAKEVLNWETKVKFEDLIKEIIESDYSQMEKTKKIE